MADAKTILILGGGIGGVATARALRKRLPKAHRVVLVDRERDHVFAPSLLWLMVGQRTPDAITRPLPRLARKGIDVRIGNVEHIDPDRRNVTVAGEALPADYLVISLGAELAPDVIPGLAQAGHNFYDRTGAASLWTALQALRAGRIIVLTAAPAYKCPAAPYEGAMLIDDWFRRQGLRDHVQIEVYAAEPAPMGVAGPHVSQRGDTAPRREGHPLSPGAPGNDCGCRPEATHICERCSGRLRPARVRAASPRTSRNSRRGLDRRERVDVGGSPLAANALAQRLRDW